MNSNTKKCTKHLGVVSYTYPRTKKRFQCRINPDLGLVREDTNQAYESVLHFVESVEGESRKCLFGIISPPEYPPPEEFPEIDRVPPVKLEGIKSMEHSNFWI